VEGVAQKAPEPLKPRRRLVRVGDVASASANDGSSVMGGKRAERERAASNSQPLEQLWKKAKEAQEPTIANPSTLADEEAVRSAPSLAKGMLLVSIKTNQRMNRKIALSSVRLSTQLLSYDPPGDGLCGFRVIFVYIQILKFCGLLLAGNKMCENMSNLSTVELKTFFLSKRTLDEKRRLQMYPVWRRDWCSTSDMERFAAFTETTFWYAGQGYGSAQKLYRVQSFDDGGPARFALSLAVVFVNGNHFQLADLSPILRTVEAEGQHIVMSTTLQQLEKVEDEYLQRKRSSVLYYSYEDDSAQNVLLQTEGNKQWLQVFAPVMEQLGWSWVSGYDEIDSVYQLNNKEMLDNNTKVTGTEALRQYFLSQGTNSAPAGEGARERRPRALVSM
jgi:hypothetical protein